MQFRLSKPEIDQRFSDRHTKAVQNTYRLGKRELHYVKTGNETGPLVLFVHGSPGSLSDFIDFLSDSTLQKKVMLISVDRPGFGQSSFGWAEPSLERQAAMIKPIIQEYKKDRPVILVGHSLGGPVIARMAMDYPDLVDGLIFVAASVDPDLEPRNWWRAPFVTPFFRWMIPRSIRASNDEIYPLKSELREMLPKWKVVRARTIIIQGTKDSLVPVANAEFVKKQLEGRNPTMIYEEGMDHFVPWSHPHLISRAIQNMVESFKENP
jgi:pimeloyl-ACP methyl ester carboxylesterase